MDPHYPDWTHKRVKLIIDHFGFNTFHGKSILDLGSGSGDIGAAFHRLGAKVIAVDARLELLKITSKKYPGIATKLVDLDKEWPFQQFDIILDLDLLNRLKNWENHLRNACASTSNIVVETAVCDSDDPHLALILPENKDIPGASFNGFSARPTSTYIERIFTECGFEFKRYDYAKLGVGKKVYDWRITNSKGTNENHRRFWIAKRVKNIAMHPPLQLVANVAPVIGQTLSIPAPAPTYVAPTPAIRYSPLDVHINPDITSHLSITPVPSVQINKAKVRLFYN